MTFVEVNEKVSEIIDFYWHEDSEYYSSSRTDENDSDIELRTELENFFKENEIEALFSEEDGFDSPGYDNSFLAVAYKTKDGQFDLRTIVFECF